MSEFKGRPFGGVEKLYLALDEIFIKTFALVAELDSKIPVDSVGPALIELAERHPQLKYRIAEDDHFQFWFLNVQDCTIPFKVMLIEDDQDWTAILADELIKPFDLFKAPLFRIVLLQKKAQSTVFLLSNHSLGDGMSVNIVLQDFLKILSGETLDHLPVPLSMDESLHELPDNKPEFSPAYSSSLKQRNKLDDAAKVYIFKLQLPELLTASLMERSRIEGTTVNGALNAAVAIAMRESDDRFAAQPLIMRLPISARKALNVQNDFALNVVTKNITMKPGDYADFWQIARSIKSELETAAAIDQVRGYVRYFRQGILRPVAIQEIVKSLEASIGTDFMLSNLGRIQESTFGKYRILAFWGPIVVSGNGTEQTIGAVTIGGQLSMTNISSSPMPALLTEVGNILAAALN